MDKILNLMNIMNTIEHGFKDENNNNIINYNLKKWDLEFYDFYYLLSPEELLIKKCGVCWDQVELERYLFNLDKINNKTFFICTYDGDNLPSHTFLTFEYNNKYFWFEHSWNDYKGIHEYNNLNELLLDVKEKFINNQSTNINSEYTFVYEYNKPKTHISCQEFYDYVETQKLVKLNKPLYFYHLVNKGVDLSNGLFSLQYMYDNKMFELFDKSVFKYFDRIVRDWNIEKYHGKKALTREEYIDGLNIFRGKYGSSYIYFFKYPPYEELGDRMKEILKYKDIYRININDEEVMRNIKDIFYGFDMSSSENKVLDKQYYENVSEKDYFSKYDDNLEMNFSRLNHIGISFIGNKCPFLYLEKVN